MIALGPILLFGFLAIVLALVVVLLARRGQKPPNVQQASCGSCLYSVVGLTTFTCPECGSDLRQVGIVTPSMRLPMSPLAMSILWSLLLPIPALIISGILISLAAPFNIYQFTNSSLASPRSQQYIEIQFDLEGEETKWPPARYQGAPPAVDAMKLTLKLQSDAEPSETVLNIDLESNQFDIDGGEPSQLGTSVSTDEQMLTSWFDSAEVDTENQQVQSELRDAAKALRAHIDRGFKAGFNNITNFGSIGGGTSSMSSGPTRGAMAVLSIFWIALWVLGIWYLHRRGRKRTTL